MCKVGMGLGARDEKRQRLSIGELTKKLHYSQTCLFYKLHLVEFVMPQFPRASVVGLLAGEKIVHGFRVSRFGNKTKRTFKPNVQRIAFFSELLNRKIVFPVSPSALLQIDNIGGIDSYLLKTDPKDFHSEVAVKWRTFLELYKNGSFKDDT